MPPHQARVVAALTEAAGVNDRSHVEVSEWEVRELKPNLALVENAVREATEDTRLTRG